MPIYVCSSCGTKDNTALTDYWHQTGILHAPPLCSACDPAIGEWHDRFPRTLADDGERARVDEHGIIRLGGAE